MGIAECVVKSISLCPPETQPHLFNNVLLVGGCACFPGFQERLQKELRAMAPEEYDVRVTVPEK